MAVEPVDVPTLGALLAGLRRINVHQRHSVVDVVGVPGLLAGALLEEAFRGLGSLGLGLLREEFPGHIRKDLWGSHF